MHWKYWKMSWQKYIFAKKFGFIKINVYAHVTKIN